MKYLLTALMVVGMAVWAGAVEYRVEWKYAVQNSTTTFQTDGNGYAKHTFNNWKDMTDWVIAMALNGFRITKFETIRPECPKCEPCDEQIEHLRDAHGRTEEQRKNTDEIKRKVKP